MTTKMRMATIAGASAALNYRQEHPRATDAEVMRYVSEKAGEIVENIDDEDY